MSNSFLEYSVTRPIALNRWQTITIMATGLLWVVFVTLLNFAATGYELVPLTSTNFNSTYGLWYERFVSPQTGWLPRSWNCQGSIIKQNEGLVPGNILPMKVVFTNSSGWISYRLLGYTDSDVSIPIDGISYNNTSFSSCEILLLTLIQAESQSSQDQVPILEHTVRR